MHTRVHFTIIFVVAILATACAQPGAGYHRPDLNDDIVARVAPGQGAAQITALLGTPYRRVRFDNLRATAWDYFFKDTWGYWVELSVMMSDEADGGRVVGKVLRRIEPADER